MTQGGPSTVEWRWVDIGGEQHKLRVEELSTMLSRGQLPPEVLVWRTGWTEWRAARSTAELAGAFGPGKSVPPAARVTPSAVTPPEPPLHLYATTVPRGTLTLERPALASTPAPPGARKPPPRPGAAAPPPTGPVPIRDVQPTLADQEPARSNTLRPMGAIPPPPRAIPPPRRPPFSSIPPVASRPPLAAPPRTPGPPEVAAKSPIDPDAKPGGLPLPRVPPPAVRAPPSDPVASAAPAPLGDPAPEEAPARVAGPEREPPALPAQPRRSPAAGVGGLSRTTIAKLTSAGVLIPGLLLLVIGMLRPSRKAALPAVSAAPVVSSPPAPPPKPPGCTIAKPAERLAESAFLAVPALLSPSPDGTRAAIGFAAAKDRAVGIKVDPADLSTAGAFEQTVTGSTTLGVVPLVRSGALEFAVDRADPQFASARTVDAEKRFTIGVNADGFARTVGSATDVIWPLPEKGAAITTPRVATVAGKGHAVVFRQGGQEGKIFGGWLHEDGTKQAELGAVTTSAALVGTPAVAATDTGALYAFAAKATASDPYHVELSTSAPGAASAFQVPGGGPGGEAISPAVGALGEGRWILQWTEGSAGNRAVRVQVLTTDLVLSGDPVTLSNANQNAGQGALVVVGKRTLALFLVQKESSHELWGASLECN
jgi:hypothetical protein